MIGALADMHVHKHTNIEYIREEYSSAHTLIRTQRNFRRCDMLPLYFGEATNKPREETPEDSATQLKHKASE